MTTESQILANRRNALKSTGPRTCKRFLRFALSLCSFVPQCLCGYESIMQNKPNFRRVRNEFKTLYDKGL